jgi:hypothetical protein
MSHKLYGFAHSSDPVLIQYVEEQLKSILIQHPDLEIELGNENHEMLVRYSTTPDRFPCLMLTKYGISKNYIHAKLSNNEAYSWFITKRG